VLTRLVVVGACFPPSPASPGSGCPQLLPGRCDGLAVKVSHLHSVQERLVALDVRDPKTVGLVAAELASDEIGGNAVGDGPSPFPTARKPLQTSCSQQQLDRAMAHGQTLTEGQLGVDPPGAVRSLGTLNARSGWIP
jgi:hypothetical protein